MILYLTFVFLLGCEKAPVNLLRFEQQQVELGVVRGGSSIRHEFSFVVAGDSEVAISELTTSCQCMAGTSAKLGVRMKSGDHGTVTIDIPLDEYGGDFVGSIGVKTVPESPVPIVLRVHGVASSYPRVTGPYPLVLKVPIGEEFVFDMDLVARKPGQAQSYIPDMENSSLCGFSLASHEKLETALPPQGGQIGVGVRERHSFRMRHPPVLKPISYDATLKIAWKGIDYRTSVAIKVITRHPLLTLTTDSFLGFVKPGKTIETSFVFADELQCTSDEILLEPASQGNDSASITSDGKRIRVLITAPIRPGRFIRTWRVLSPNRNLPALELKVAGIVHE